MRKFTRSVWDALFGQRGATPRIPRWLAPAIRFGYLVIQEFSRNRCPEKASALGFQTVFSLIPALALALFFFRVPVFGDSAALGFRVQNFLIHQLNLDMMLKVSEADNAAKPEQTTPAGEPSATVALDKKIQDRIEAIYQELAGGGLSIASFLWLIVTALMLALTIEKSLNDIWGSVAKRRLLRRVAVYWSVLTLGPLFIGLSFYVTDRVRLNSFSADLALSVAGPLLAFYLMYQLMPAASVRAVFATAGALVAAMLWLLTRFLFGVYVDRYVGYGKLYGNLGLFPLFLFWVWLVWIIVLVGAEVAYTLQNLDRLTAEERRRRGAPFIQPGLMALGLVLHAGRAFASGKGPVAADELAESTGLPDHLWLRLVNLLQERGILVEAGPDGSRFTPGRPLDSLRVEEVFAAVEASLVARPDESGHPEETQLKTLSNLLVQARQRELRDTTVADLLRTQQASAAAESVSGSPGPDGRPTPAQA